MHKSIVPARRPAKLAAGAAGLALALTTVLRIDRRPQAIRKSSGLPFDRSTLV